MKISTRLECIIRKHRAQKLDRMDRLFLLILLCIEDGAIQLSSRRDSIIEMQLCINAMEKCGLIYHADKGSKKSKTKTMFFLFLVTLKR